MGTVLTHMTMSLDGFIAAPDDHIDELFCWYDAGGVEVPSADPGITFHVDASSADLLRTMMASSGALVCGRRLFDITHGWGDAHPMGVPVVVVTHRPPEEGAWRTTSFAGDVASAVARAQEIAGDRDVLVASADIARQALELGLVDEIAVSLAPVLMGTGIRYFADLEHAPYRLGDPVVVEGSGATHLRYAVLGRERPGSDASGG